MPESPQAELSTSTRCLFFSLGLGLVQLFKATIEALTRLEVKNRTIMASLGGIRIAHGASQDANIPAPASTLDLPSVDKVLSDLPELESSLQPQGTAEVQSEEQENMFRALKQIIEQTGETSEVGAAFDLKELHASLEQAEGEARRGRRDAETLKGVLNTLHQLWSCNSRWMAQAAEILANGSRERKCGQRIGTLLPD